MPPYPNCFSVVRLAELPPAQQISCRSDANGRWQIDGLNGDSQILVRAARDGAAHVYAVMRPGVRSDIVIPTPVVVDVAVVNESDNKRLDGVGIATRQLDASRKQMVFARHITGKDGAIQMRLPIGKNSFTLSSPLSHLVVNSSHEVDVNQTMKPIELGMPVGVPVTLQMVHDDDSKPFRSEFSNFSVADEPTYVIEPDTTFQFGPLRLESLSRRAEGIATGVCKAGELRFVANPGIQGYEVVNPMHEPVTLTAGEPFEYVFRIRKPKKFRSTFGDNDDTHRRSKAHQDATKLLRDLGANVSSNGMDKTAVTQVNISQLWEGQPADLRRLRELEYVQYIGVQGYVVPKEFQTNPKRTLPIVTDEWLIEFGGLSKPQAIWISNGSEITDTGLAHLKGCASLATLTINGSNIRGKGLESLSATDLRQIQIRSSEFDLADVDLSSLSPVRQLELTSDTKSGIVLPSKMPPKLSYLKVIPADTMTIRGLNKIDSVMHISIGGDSLTDESLSELEVRAGMMLTLVNVENVTNAGIASLADKPIASLCFSGKQFTDELIPHCIRMPNLKRLYIGKMSISQQGIEQLRTSRPKLDVELE